MKVLYRTRYWFVVPVCVGVLAAFGCGSTRSIDARSSGFLGDLSALQSIDAQAGGEVLVREAGVIGRYDRFLLDPVVIVFAKDAAASAIDPEDLARLTASLRDKVDAQLRDGGYEIVDAAGPGVLRIRAALTDVNPSRPAANVAGKVAGIASGVGGFVVPTIDLGGAAIEAEMIDATTGERVAAYRDARRGKRFGGTLDAARRWGHAEDAFDVWAAELRDRLDALRGEP
jgi:hypothetical protein